MTKKGEEKEWWADGVRFQCQGSGQCCVSRGEYGYVFLTKDDRRRMAKELKTSTSAFTRKYCDKLGPAFHLKEEKSRPECMFLNNNRCQVYKARPTQCRTWPWWPETLPAKAWKKELIGQCPGVGKGRLVSAKEIRENLNDQVQAEKEISGQLRGL